MRIAILVFLVGCVAKDDYPIEPGGCGSTCTTTSTPDAGIDSFQVPAKFVHVLPTCAALGCPDLVCGVFRPCVCNGMECVQ